MSASIRSEPLVQATVLTIPGINGSGAEHWQTKWERSYADVRRVEQDDWDRPGVDAWTERLDAEVRACDDPPVLVAHSLGCLLISYWVSSCGGRARAALAVAPPDPSSAGFPVEAASFAAPPPVRLPFSALVVASRDDPYGGLEYGLRLAETWGARCFDAGRGGHLNAASDLGDWAVGVALLRELVEDCPTPAG